MSGSLSLPSSTTRLIPIHLYLNAPPSHHVPCLIPPTTTVPVVAASPGIAKPHVCLVYAQLLFNLSLYCSNTLAKLKMCNSIYIYLYSIYIRVQH